MEPVVTASETTLSQNDDEEVLGCVGGYSCAQICALGCLGGCTVECITTDGLGLEIGAEITADLGVTGAFDIMKC
jgi:hypothetical protein